MKERIEDGNSILTLEMFNKSLEELWKYQFIIKSGYDFKNALFSLFQLVWDKELIPERWTQTTVIQLYKGVNSFQELPNFRNIHLREDVSKAFTNIVVNCVKETIMNNNMDELVGSI